MPKLHYAKVWHVLVECDLLKEALQVSNEVGIPLEEIVRLLLAELVKSRKIPFSLSENDDLVDVIRQSRILGELDDCKEW